MAMSKQDLSKAISESISKHVESLLTEALSNARDQLDNVVSAVESAAEDAVSDARYAMELSDSDLEEAREHILNDLMKQIAGNTDTDESAALDELRAAWSTGPVKGIEQLLGRRISDVEVHTLLGEIASQYEGDFALFLWKARR